MDLNKFTALKAKVRKLEDQAVTAQAKLDEFHQRMKKLFQVTTTSEARKLLTKMEKEEEELEDAFNKAFQQFKKEWNDAFQDDDKHPF